MIKVIYDGNLGNNLFQYCFGRLLAEQLGYELIADPIKGFSETFLPVRGASYPEGDQIVLRGQKPDLSFLHETDPKYSILLTGYFQRHEYYKNHRDNIRRWLKMDLQLTDIEVAEKDVVVGMRRGRDYIPESGLPMSYYLGAIASLEPQRVYICTDQPEDPMVKAVKRRYGATVRTPGALDNLAFISSFKQIVISNSSFLWWAAFLSDANRIVFPRPQNGYWAATHRLSKNIALEVDSPEYYYLNCEKYRSKFFSERIENIFDFSSKRLRATVRRLLPFLTSGPPPRSVYYFNEEFDDS